MGCIYIVPIGSKCIRDMYVYLYLYIYIYMLCKMWYICCIYL